VVLHLSKKKKSPWGVQARAWAARKVGAAVAFLSAHGVLVPVVTEGRMALKG